MKIVFAGTPDFAAASLDALIKAGFDIPLVLSQPDRPAGRGRKLKASEVKQLALDHQIRVETPLSLSLKKGGEEAVAIRELLNEIQPDLLVVVAYGLILPQDILELPKGIEREGFKPVKAINVHGSILPRWRGAAPIARGIEAQDKEAGITIMEMDVGLDTGDMLYKEAVALNGTETAETLTAELAAKGAEMLVHYLKNVESYPPEKQDESASCYASKLMKTESPLDFSRPAAELSAKIRAFNLFPGTHFTFEDQQIKVWNAVALDAKSSAEPGTVIAVRDGKALEVACGDQTVLSLKELQRPGGKKLEVRQFLTGFKISEGAQLK